MILQLFHEYRWMDKPSEFHRRSAWLRTRLNTSGISTHVQRFNIQLLNNEDEDNHQFAGNRNILHFILFLVVIWA
jgi:hypothetical protein